MSFTRYGSLEGRTVIITGGASGIGASFVRAFVENGAKVAFLDLQRETGAALADSLGECAARPIRAALGAAAVLVNNAANDPLLDGAGRNAGGPPSAVGGAHRQAAVLSRSRTLRLILAQLSRPRRGAPSGRPTRIRWISISGLGPL
jgi:NAD(P)-dependent dehydrogenase (short-subunit alcohol dehydrogenase family)